MRHRNVFLIILLLLCIIVSIPTSNVAADNGFHGDRRDVKVMIITTFNQTPFPDFPGEATLWLQRDRLDKRIEVKGLPKTSPAVYCNNDGECLVITGSGYVNSTASMMALLLSDKFDFKRTYFLLAGIGGVAPTCGTLGTPVWIRAAIDAGLAYEIDAREIPADWTTGYFAYGTTGPNQPPLEVGPPQVYTLNDRLLRKAVDLSKKVQLMDSPEAQAYRANYPNPPANQPPVIAVGESIASNTYYYGNLLSKRGREWVSQFTYGTGTYCITDSEDNAILGALFRGSEAGLLDFRRVAVLRAGAGFDSPFPGRTAYEGLVIDQQGGFGGYIPAINNLYSVGQPLVKEILRRWRFWEHGVP